MTDYLIEMWKLAASGDKQGISFFASIYAFLVLGYSVVYQIRVAMWPETKGELSKATVERVGGTELVTSHQNYASRSLYEYSVAGVAYQGTRVSPWVMVASHNARFVLERQLSHIGKNEDGTVRVFYNPNKPSKSFLIKPGKAGIVFTFILTMAPMILYWYFYHA